MTPFDAPGAAAYQRNGQTVTAGVFYAIACDPRRSVAVEACAGAGKTWMLVSRIVRALLPSPNADPNADADVRPQDILAITFTKKAAGEMRERLDEWLKAFAQADDETLLRELAVRGVPAHPSAGPSQTRQLAALYRAVLTSGRSVQVRTFHSWFAALLKSSPMAVFEQLKLPVNYTLLEDDAPAKALVWRRFFTALLADTALKSDYEAVVLAHGRFQTDKALSAALDKRTEFALADAVGVVQSSVLPFGTQFPQWSALAAPEDALKAPQAAALLLAAAKAMGRASAKTFSALGVALERAVADANFDGMLAALLTGTGTPRKLGEKIVGIELVRSAQDLVLAVRAARQQHEAWVYQQRMARLARLLIAQFAALKRERGWIDMNDVERAAFSMLGDPVLSGWVQERLDARIKHLMIDEFQDTNPLQWQALSAWLSGYGGAGAAPSVFLVGDPKQSIYRFRRAEPQVFKAAQAFVVNALGGDVLTCDHTRRNAAGVIATVNAVMLDAAHTDAYDGFRPHTTASERTGSLGRLPPIPRALAADDEVDDADGAHDAGRAEPHAQWRDSLSTPRQLPEETLRSLEARQAAAWIARQVAAGMKPADIMVLSRKRAGLLPLQQALQALQVPAQIGEKTDLIDCCEVQDITALLDVLVSPPHDLSLARALRSPLFGLPDDDLVALAVLQRSHRLPWFDLLQKTQLLPQSLRELAAVLMRWKRWLDTLPPHDALQAIYDDGDVLARFAAAAPAAQRTNVLANLRALLGVALGLGGGRYATPYGLVRALKSGGTLAPSTLQSQAVRLLTIHGAKGLEADAVLLLDTDTAPRNADSMTVLIDWPGADAAPQKFVFLVSEKSPPACALPALEAEQAARAREELNALYVAMTRARNTLVMSSVEPHRDSGRSWWQRLLPHLPELSVVPDGPVPTLPGDTATASETPGEFVLPVLPAAPAVAPGIPEHSPANADEPPAATPADAVSARVGKAMHRLLEWGAVTGPDQAPARAAVQAAAREFALSPAQAQQAVALAQRISRGAGAWAWDPGVVGWQGDEVDMTHQGQALRLDRLVQRLDAGHEGHWWVLDYKSAAQPQHQQALVAKMQQYRAAVQQAFPASVVKAAFLTGQGEIIEVALNVDE